MKKIVVVLAIAAMSFVASASNVKWGIGGGGALNFSDGTIYLVVGSIPTTDWSSKSAFSESDITGDILSSAALSNGAYYNSSGESMTPDSTGLTKGNKTVYAIAISADGKQVAVSTGTASINIQSSALSAGAAFTGFNHYTAAVPEPTSALLLLLGFAGLGLKRKLA